MTAMFYGRINNPEWKLPWYDIRKLSSQFKLVPSYAYGRLEPLAYLRQLTLIYQCLADKTVEDSRKRAENAMHLMVNHKVGPGFLNLLPIGLAAPLREAARTCQLAPGQDWPAAAYEFVGRNDLAEGANANPGLLNTNGYRAVKEFLVSNLEVRWKLQSSYVFRVITNDRAYHRWFIRQFLQPLEKLVRVQGWS
jgi:anaphase-promoting complex subunit 1